MALHLEAAIRGAEIRCLIGSDALLPAPVWCFSLLAPGRVVSGGTLIRSLAGYTEVQLPDLQPGQPREVVLAQAEPGLRPANRAWLPLGGYLRIEDDATLPLPPLRLGVAPGAERPAPPPEGLPLVPPPLSWAPAGGSLDAPRGFDCPDDDALRAVARLAERLGLGPFHAAGGAPLRVRHDLTLPPEGYRLDLAPDGATLRAGDRAGRLHGGITLLNLLATTGGRLPTGRIEDAPRFAWRGQHLDCARHFYAPATLGRLLDLMALLKLNRFHWHLSDDEAFRLEVEAAPELWQRTARRGEGLPVPGVFGGGEGAGGTYSKAEVAALVAQAEDLGIGILPAVEVPAHSFALCAVVPGVRDPEDRGAEASAQGYPRNVVNPAMSATWDLLLPLVAEVAAMFPLGMLHLGCDELPAGAWDGSPAVDRLKAARGLATRDDVQGWMMERLAGHLAGQGIRAAAWEEAARGANGGIGHGSLLFSWTGQSPGIAAARAGYDVVMCPAPHAYLDMAHTADPDDWGAAWAGPVGLEATVDWRVVPPGAEDVAPRIVGVQGCFWSEFTTEDAQMEPMLAPRLLGIAAKAWAAQGRMDGDGLRALAGAYGPVLDRIGWRRNRGA